MTRNPDREAVKRYDRWLENEITVTSAKKGRRRMRHQHTLVKEATIELKILNKCKGMLEHIHREESKK